MKRIEPTGLPFLDKVINKIYQTAMKARKALFQRYILKPTDDKTILFIIGCQRSGTTLTQRIFENDLNIKVYGERSKLSSLDLKKKLRLNPIVLVQEELAKDRVPLVVIRTLVETQNILKLFDSFPNAKAVFIYRNFRDVASSNIRYFGETNGINDLRPIFHETPNNWRSEYVSDEAREAVRKLFSENMNPYDAAALFWYVRNDLFFSLHLDKHPDVYLCRYEDLVESPLRTVSAIYDFIAQPFPGAKIVEEVHSMALGRGRELNLSPEIENICSGLLGKLDGAFRKKNGERQPRISDCDKVSILDNIQLPADYQP